MTELLKGPATVLGPEDGDSYWQPGPHYGHMTIKVSPTNSPCNSFSMGTQLLPAGCHVRHHGHARNDEILFIYEGTGKVVIDDETHRLEPGSTVLLGRFVGHSIFNDGATDMKFVWFFTPPGLERVVEASGRRRVPGDPPPQDLTRPANMAQVLDAAGYATPEQIAASKRN